MTPEELAAHNQSQYGVGEPVVSVSSSGGVVVVRLAAPQAVTVMCGTCGRLPVPDDGFERACHDAMGHAEESSHQVTVLGVKAAVYGPGT